MQSIIDNNESPQFGAINKPLFHAFRNDKYLSVPSRSSYEITVIKSTSPDNISSSTVIVIAD